MTQGTEPSTGTPAPAPQSSRLNWALREAIAIAAWLYVIVKLFVLDVDVNVVERYAPTLRWLLDLKFFVLVSLVAGLSLVLGKQRFVPFFAYVVCYPLVLLFWRVPLAAFRRWPIVIAFVPALHRAITTLRSTFLMYTTALLAGLAVIIGRDPNLLTVAMTALGVFLVAHLYRAFRKVYVSSLFSQLTDLARKFRMFVESGRLDASLTAKPHPDTIQADPAASLLTNFYVFPSMAAVIAEKVSKVARGRKYDLYLTLSWVYTVALTAIVFAFEYLALHKIDPSAFRLAEHSGFWAFFAFSLGVLATTTVSPISAASPLAVALCSTEVVGSVLMLIILVFTVLTAAREAFRQDVDDFSQELRLISQAYERRAVEMLQLTMEEVEYQLIEKHEDIVKWLRKHRGLTELPPPRKKPPAGDGA